MLSNDVQENNLFPTDLWTQYLYRFLACRPEPYTCVFLLSFPVAAWVMLQAVFN